MTDVTEPGPSRSGTLPNVPGGGAPAARGRGPLVIAVVLVSVGIGAWAVVSTREPREPATDDANIERDDREDRRMAQFAGKLRDAVAAMRSRSYADAAPHLVAAASLQPHAHVTRLMQLNAALADKPTKHVDQILELSQMLGELRSNVWTESGVVKLAREIFDTWKHECTNARYAGIGDDMLADGLWSDALEQYTMIPRDSPLYVARLRLVDAARAQVGDEVRRLILVGEIEKALAKLDVAFGPAAAIEVEHARALWRGRKEITAQSYDAAKTVLESIPSSSAYFGDAASELARVDHQLTKREVLRLYQLGDGPKALALLKGQIAQDMVRLREKIEAVVSVYTQAQALYEKRAFAPANDMWDTLIRMVGDPSNQYTKWAEANKKVDPTGPSELVMDAAELWAAGRVYEAARINTQALIHDPKNTRALRLRSDIERAVGLMFAITRQWPHSHATTAAFLVVARENYVLLRAGSPNHPLLGTIAEHIVKAGGTVPATGATGAGS